MIVTIDGPAGSGKSTAARGLAARLGFQFLDTGAMYRVVAWKCRQERISPEDEQAVGELAERIRIVFEQQRVFVDQCEVTAEIRSNDVTHAASVVAVNPRVRQALNELQRRYADQANVVTEGRDQGTVVFPHAECKFYFTADARQRAQRRQRELSAHGTEVPLEELVQQIRDRDVRDASRDVAPLRCADDAIRIDTSTLSPEAVLDKLEAHVRARM